MYYVYLLKSKKDNSLYLGYSNNIKRRLLEHNLGKNTSTSLKTPWELIYCEVYKSQDDAQKRESKLKHHGKGIQELKKRLEKSLS